MNVYSQGSAALMLVPGGGALAAGSLYRLRRARAPLPNMAWGAIAASLIFAASAASYAYQAFRHREIGLALTASTIAFAVAIVAIGLAAVALTASNPPRTHSRLLIVTLAILGFFCWAGPLWGPGLAMAAAILPEDSARQRDATGAEP